MLGTKATPKPVGPSDMRRLGLEIRVEYENPLDTPRKMRKFELSIEGLIRSKFLSVGAVD